MTPAPTPVQRLLGALLLALIVSAGAGAENGAEDVVVIVSAHSPVTELARHEVVDIYLGRRNRFPDGGEVTPIDQRQGSGTRARFYSQVAGLTHAQVKAHWSRIVFTGRGRPPYEARDSHHVLALVASNADAIGYVERQLVDETVRVVDLR